MPGDAERKLVKERARGRLFAGAATAVRVGRYELRDQIGQGAMGVVYAAYDARLDRKLAIKFVQAGTGSSDAQARMLREAKAMARMSHPNVVQVYDAGQFEDQLFIAMEFVDGGTLRARLEDDAKPRTWLEILRLFVAAGRGVAAAHAAGVVHRDFKPDNVLLTGDGQPKVADFGLAGLDDAPAEPPATDDESVTDPQLTATGALLGTPLYMSPEQHDGLPADARSDQFAFCVAMYEALYAARPFEGKTRLELVDNVSAGRVRTPARDAGVPSAVLKILSRGLAAARESRYPSMDALLSRLASVPGRRRRRWGAAALLVVTAGGLGAHQLYGRQQTAACERAGDSVRAVWNDEIRAEARAAFDATGLPYADPSFVGVDERLRAYLDRWARARTQICTDAEIRGSLARETFERSRECLDERAAAARALVDRYRGAGVATVRASVSAVADLRDVEACSDAAVLARRPAAPKDVETARSVAAARLGISEANAALALGDYESAVARLQEAEAGAQGVAYAPLQVELKYWAGYLADRQADYKGAAKLFEEAFFEAGRAQYTELEADAAVHLTHLARMLERYDEGLRWASHAEAALGRLGAADPIRQSRRLAAVARLELALGQHDDAAASFREALVLVRDAYGETHPTIAQLETNAGLVLSAQAHHAEAIEAYQRAAAIQAAAFGDSHPSVARNLNNIAMARLELGDLELAAREFERSLEILEAAAGSDSEEAGKLLANLGSLSRRLGNLDRALEYNRRSVEVFRRAVGPDSLGVAMGLHNIGNVLVAQGHIGRAIENFKTCEEVAARALGPRHPAVAMALTSLGAAHYYNADYVQAEEAYRRALEMRREALGPEHPRSGVAQVYLGMALREQGRTDEAVAEFEGGLKVQEAAQSDPVELAKARFNLAMALWDGRRRDRPRALELAGLAREGYAGLGERVAEELVEVEGWLARKLTP